MAGRARHNPVKQKIGLLAKPDLIVGVKRWFLTQDHAIIVEYGIERCHALAIDIRVNAAEMMKQHISRRIGTHDTI